ncbi:MAG TPA: hypothetical protein VJ063_08480 [Verrucomicrobiae bacterium]|nr:hypothetical protein [Verrucomicrobiae bacterium]
MKPAIEALRPPLAPNPNLNLTPNLFLRVYSFPFILFALFFASSASAANVDRIARIADPDIKECSGIVASRQYPDVFWVHNDGKREHLYAINRKGATLAQFKIKGAEFHDWEDITMDAGNNLYAADTGNNDAKRMEVAVYRFREPNPKHSDKSIHVTRQWTLRYPLAPRDCESIVVVGTNGYLISKVTGNKMAEVFSFPLEGSDGPITLKSLAHLVIDSPVTAAAVSSDGKTLAAISKEGAFFFEFDGTFLSTKLLRPRNRVVFLHQSIEGCTFVPDGLLVAAESRELFLFKIPGT